MKIKYYLSLFAIVVSEYFQQSIKEITANIWTFVGLFATWIVLTGTAKNVLQQVILYAFAIWLLTIGLRLPKDDKEVIMLKQEARKIRSGHQAKKDRKRKKASATGVEAEPTPVEESAPPPTLSEAEPTPVEESAPPPTLSEAEPTPVEESVPPPPVN
jgi:hypothetical protein